MQGTRVHNPKGSDIFGKPGAYGKVGDVWLACLPNGQICHLNAGHTITEHADGTITVSPSILLRADRAENGQSWHGWLENGVWREA